MRMFGRWIEAWLLEHQARVQHPRLP